MATATLIPTAITDTNANIASGVVGNIDNTIASANDSALVTSIINDWLPSSPGTGTAVTFTMSDLPGNAVSINTVQFRVRARRQGTAGGDTWGVTFDVQGTSVPTTTAVWTQADGTAFSNKGAASPVSSTATVANVNGWTVRAYMSSWVKDKGFDNMYLDISEIEIIVDYNIGALTESHTFTIQQAFNLQNFKSVSEAISYIINLDKTEVISIDTALNFILQVAQEQDNNKIIPLSVNLQSALNFIFSNILTGSRSVTIGSLLDTVFSSNKTTLENALFSTNLNYGFSTSVAGSVEFGTVLAYQADNVKTTLASLNADIVIDQASTISKLLTETSSFSFTLDFDGVYTEVAIFDDPVYSLSNEQYIFVDLNSILLSEGTIKAASITFTNQQGQTQTVALVGQAAHQFLVSLAQLQTANKVTSATNVLNIVADQNQLASLLREAALNIDLNLDYLTQSQAAYLRAALFQFTASQSQLNVKDTNNILTLSSILDQTQLNTLLASATVSFDTTLDFLRSATKDTTIAINFLSSLDFVTDATVVLVETINFDISLLQTQQVQGILTAAINLINSLDSTYAKQLAARRTIQYLTQLNYQFSTDGEIFETISFIAQMNQINTNNISAAATLAFVVQLAELKNLTLTTTETLTLAIQLADTYVNNKVSPTSLALNVTVNQTQTSLLDKLIALAFSISLDKVSTGSITFQSFITLAAALDAAFTGDVTGALEGLITFGVQLQQQNLGLGIFNKNISFSDVFSLDGIGSKLLLDSLNLTIQLEDGRSFDLTKYGFVNFDILQSKSEQVQIDFRPVVNFDLQMLEVPTSIKNTLANILMSIEQAMLQDTISGVIAAMSFGIQQNYQTEFRLIAEGTAEFSAQLAQSQVLQFLGQAGITFGHLVGLSALSRADFAKSISYGTISEFTVSGFVLAFTITLPNSRKVKVYFEDRITIIYPEERLMVVYPVDNDLKVN